MIAALSAGVPATSVYLVCDAAIACTTASHAFGGVSKSGSPEVSPRMSRPAVRSSRARWLAMELGEGLMRFRRAAMMLNEMTPAEKVQARSRSVRESDDRGTPCMVLQGIVAYEFWFGAEFTRLARHIRARRPRAAVGMGCHRCA